MRYIATLFLLCTVALAQWGPGGIPTDWRDYGLEWMEATKFTSPLATSYISMVGDSVIYTQTGVNANRNHVSRYYDADGTMVAAWWYDDSNNFFRFNDDIYVFGLVSTAATRGVNGSGYWSLNATTTAGWLDLNIDASALHGSRWYGLANDTLQVGIAGTVNHFQSLCDTNEFTGNLQADTLQMDVMQGGIIEISASTYTATLSYSQILLTVDCDVVLPTIAASYEATDASSGYGAIISIKAENLTGCTVDGDGTETIDGSDTEITMSAWDNIVLMATADGWIIQ